LNSSPTQERSIPKVSLRLFTKLSRIDFHLKSLLVIPDKCFLALFLLFILSGCPHISTGIPEALKPPWFESSVPARGTYHEVSGKETLSEIADAYKVDSLWLAELNNLEKPYTLKPGMKIFIPGALQTRKPVLAPDKPPPAEKPLENFTGILSWPVIGPLASQFGVREGIQYNGILIEAKEGTPVVSSADGKVGHVGTIPGYGNVIILEHANRLVTVYAHLSDMKVSSGKEVKRGQVIGTVGKSGRVDKAALYFEVRSRSKPRNPLFFLSSRS
jgi:murein DD-endopeptidase MepM/ murein hydrolase activator NlpD